MSDEKKVKPGESNDPEQPMQGVNLKLIYSLIALAIIAAMAVAFFIVLPFYHHSGH
jgi:hypothetical protein